MLSFSLYVVSRVWKQSIKAPISWQRSRQTDRQTDKHRSLFYSTNLYVNVFIQVFYNIIRMIYRVWVHVYTSILTTPFSYYVDVFQFTWFHFSTFFWTYHNLHEINLWHIVLEQDTQTALDIDIKLNKNI